MDPTLATTLTQFGVAGLIGWMWLSERRSASERDKQLEDSHTMLAQGQKGIDVLLKALDDNTRAITALEAAQRQLVGTLARASMQGAVPSSPKG